MIIRRLSTVNELDDNISEKIDDFDTYNNNIQINENNDIIL